MTEKTREQLKAEIKEEMLKEELKKEIEQEEAGAKLQAEIEAIREEIRVLRGDGRDNKSFSDKLEGSVRIEKRLKELLKTTQDIEEREQIVSLMNENNAIGAMKRVKKIAFIALIVVCISILITYVYEKRTQAYYEEKNDVYRKCMQDARAMASGIEKDNKFTRCKLILENLKKAE